jgi:hypothetical protein
MSLPDSNPSKRFIEIERVATRMAYDAGFGASEWEAFVKLAEEDLVDLCPAEPLLSGLLGDAKRVADLVPVRDAVPPGASLLNEGGLERPQVNPQVIDRADSGEESPVVVDDDRVGVGDCLWSEHAVKGTLIVAESQGGLDG